MQAQRAYLVLKSPITLRGRMKGGQPIAVTLPVGESLRLIAQSPNKRNQTPFMCQSDKWPVFFMVGQNHTVETRLEEIPE